MSIVQSKDSFQVRPQFRAMMRSIGLDGPGIFRDTRIIPWRTLPDRENCTLDTNLSTTGTLRLHVKRYQPARGIVTPARREVEGYRSLAEENIPTASLVAWGELTDRRSFTIWADLTDFVPADKLIASGTPFDRLLLPTADLAALLHARGLHHRDLYLCHFMCGQDSDPWDLRLIDVARVRRLGGILTRRRWVIKDLAQFWFSTLKLPISDVQRHAWIQRYASQRGDGASPDRLCRAIWRKVRRIAAHDRNLNREQPMRNISIPPTASAPRTPLF